MLNRKLFDPAEVGDLDGSELIQIVKDGRKYFATLDQLGIVGAVGTGPEQTVTDNYLVISDSSMDDKVAIKSFVDTGVNDLWYDKMVAVYVLNGSALDKKVFNLINPLDQDGAFRLLRNGVTDSVKGININGTAQGICTFIDPSLIADKEQIGASWYIQQAMGVEFLQLRASDLSGANAGFSITPRHTDGKAYPSIWASSVGITVPALAGGFGLAQREAGSVLKVRFAGTDYTEAKAVNNYTTNGKYICAYGNASGAYDLSYLAIHQALTDAERTSYETAVNTLMTALGRNV